MDATYDLARYLCNTRYEDIPSDVVEVTKKEILDSLATGLAGSSAVGIREIVEIVKDWGGKSESSILVYRGA